MEAKDVVREVQFNPVSMNDIVAGYESGNIQVRDTLAELRALFFVVVIDYQILSFVLHRDGIFEI